MSTTLEDLKGGVSNCCGASIYQNYGICSDCKEHCDAVKECVGCESTELTKCDETMCVNCWSKENE